MKEMGAEGKMAKVEKKKVVAISILFVTSIALVLLGAVLIASGMIYGTNFTVIGSRIPSAVFGLIIMFLGARYFMSVLKLKTEIYKTSSQFSWNNFKKAKG